MTTLTTNSPRNTTLTIGAANSSVPRFGRRARTLRDKGPLTDDQIRTVAPSIFATHPSATRSERYAYIPTSDVLGALRKAGFLPFMVTQGGTRDPQRREFTKHMLRLRHESALQVGVGQTFNELVLVNSHDGTSSYQLMAGLFRLVCSNGMIVGAGGGFDEVRIKHTGVVTDAVVEGANTILQRLPEVNESVREWDGMALTAGERMAFATAAHALRFAEPALAPIEAPRLLQARRTEDARPTIWNTLNVLQENTVKGGIEYELKDENGKRKQRRKTGEVAGIEQNVTINRGLWVLAAEMAKLKAQG
jgi:hypothetical protein